MKHFQYLFETVQHSLVSCNTSRIIPFFSYSAKHGNRNIIVNKLFDIGYIINIYYHILFIKYNMIFSFLIKECIFRYYNLFDIALFDTKKHKAINARNIQIKIIFTNGVEVKH